MFTHFVSSLRSSLSHFGRSPEQSLEGDLTDEEVAYRKSFRKNKSSTRDKEIIMSST